MNGGVSVIGLGNLGAALAGALLDAGHEVTVWNRTTAKAESFGARGASIAASAEEAVTAMPHTLVCLFRYDQLRDGLSGMGVGDLEGRTIVNLGWGSPEEAEELGEWIGSLGGAYLDGGVPVTPSEIGLPTTELIYSGPRDVWDRSAPVLRDLGGASQWLGERFGIANVVSLAIPGTYYQVAYGVFLEAVAYAAARGVPPAALKSITRSSTKVLESAVDDALDRIATETYDTDQVTIDVILDSLLVVRDAMDTAGQRGTMARAMIDVLERASADGRGEDGCASVFPLLRHGG